MQDLAIRFFNNKCFVSHIKFKKRDGFGIHHLSYKSGDLKFNQFPKTVKGRKSYLEHLRSRVELNPTRFRLLKKMWHTLVDAYPNRSSRINGLSRIKQEEWERLKILVDDTERKTRRKSK